MNILRRLAKELIIAWVKYDPTLQADDMHFSAIDSGIGRRVTITIRIEPTEKHTPPPMLKVERHEVVSV